MILNITSDLEAERATYILRVDEEAEKARSLFITLGSGQSMTYEAKYQEALDLSKPTPFIDMEAEDSGQSREAVAEMILAQRTAWEQAGVLIERLRLAAKRDIRNATTPEEVFDTFRALCRRLPQ